MEKVNLPKNGTAAQGTSSSISICRCETGYLFRVAGRGTLRESPSVRDFVCGALEDGADVVMDFSECVHLDSTFLGCLVVLQERGRQQGGSFQVFAAEPASQRLFGVSHLDRVLSFADRLPECLGPPVTLQVTNLPRDEFCEHLIDTHRKIADLGGPAAGTFRRIVEQLEKEL
jgi:anti-anti-sigma regulatory factor